MAKREFMEYMGKRVKSFPDGNALTRENFISEQNKTTGLEMWYTDDALRDHLDEVVQPYIENALLSYDINMRYFGALNEKRFNEAINCVANALHMDFVENLTDFNGKSGIYMMVLDQYKSFYIGQSTDISKRVASHWSKSMEIWRLVFGPVLSSILSINVFRAFDTTRIYAVSGDLDVDDLFRFENYLTGFVMERGFGNHMLNRIMGGNIMEVDIWRDDMFDHNEQIVTDDDKKRAREIQQMFAANEKYRKLGEL